MPKVALIGLGNMGAGMASQLLRAGYHLTVWNRSLERAKTFEQEGASVAVSPREAAAEAEVIISMVADDGASRLVWMGADGALAGARPGTVLIESSTVSPTWIRELAIAAGEKGCDLLDAPVTGSKLQAAGGELLFLVGGESRVLEQVLPVLRVMSRDVMHLGPVGSGALMKLINNFVCGVQAAALGEAIALIGRSELDPDQALMILLNGAPASPLVKTIAPRMVARDYTVNFALELMRKDLSYASAEAERKHFTLRTAPAALNLFDRAVEQGFGKLDFSAVVEPLYQ